MILEKQKFEKRIWKKKRCLKLILKIHSWSSIHFLDQDPTQYMTFYTIGTYLHEVEILKQILV